MIWVGTEQEIGLLATLCDEAVLSVPEVKGDGTAVPDNERVTTKWGDPLCCAKCGTWGLLVMDQVISALPQVSLEQWTTDHSHTPSVAEQRAAVAEFIVAGVTPEQAAQVSNGAVAAVYEDLVKAGIV